MKKLAKRLADRLSRSIELDQLGTPWGHAKYIAAAFLYAWSDKPGGSNG